MVGSGIGVSDECVSLFNDMKVKKASKYLIFHIADDLVKVLDKGAADATYEEFLSKIPTDEPRYALFDFTWDQDGVPRSKLVFFSWIPDTAKVRPKMIYASTKETIKAKIEGGLIEVQGTDKSEITAEVVEAKCRHGAH
jgi:cofilin